jgi:hypothetical protein
MRSEIIDVFGPRTEGLLRAGDELWGRLLKGMFYVLRVARDGREILSEGPPPGSGLGPVRARRLWWYPGRGFAIEHVVTDDGTLVHRCHLNGPLHRQWVPAGQEPAPAPPGFVSIDAWDVEPFGRVHRQYLRMDDGAYNIWVISIQGAEVRTSGGPGKAWHADEQIEACADAAAARARAEQLISARLADGFALRLVEFLGARRHLPVPPLTPSPDPYAAVDAAMARVVAVLAQFPRAHFVVEALRRPEDRATWEALGYGDYFEREHETKFGRWRALGADPAPPDRTRSSFAYFLARYGSITWIVSSAADDGLAMFYCGNTSGGGWCCLEVGAINVDLEMLEDEHPGLGYGQARPFHGGWGRTGYLFDTRSATTTGEHAIAPFTLDGPMEDLLDAAPTAPAAIEPFGFWLEREVHHILAQLAPRLPIFQGAP